MFELLTSEKLQDIIQRSLEVIEEHKTTMLTLKMALDTGVEGFPSLSIGEVDFPEGWNELPNETFRGSGQYFALEHTESHLILYYKISSGSYFLTHSVNVPFILQVAYGRLTCTINNKDMQKGSTTEAKADLLHQLCFPVDTGMVITFDLTQMRKIKRA